MTASRVGAAGPRAPAVAWASAALLSALLTTGCATSALWERAPASVLHVYAAAVDDAGALHLAVRLDDGGDQHLLLAPAVRDRFDMWRAQPLVQGPFDAAGADDEWLPTVREVLLVGDLSPGLPPPPVAEPGALVVFFGAGELHVRDLRLARPDIWIEPVRAPGGWPAGAFTWRALVTPLTVAFDVITAPLQVLKLAVDPPV